MDQYFVFVMTVFAVSIIPGPSMLLALTNGVCHGIRKSIMAALGNVLVTALQASVSVMGLGVLLANSESAFQIVKWAGACYLFYMGVCLLLSPKLALADMDDQAKSPPNLFWQAALITASNPKAVVFFTAIFPQFIVPEQALFTQSIIMVSTCMLIAFCCFMAYTLFGQRLMRLFAQTGFLKYFKRVVGGSFIGSGIALAFSHR